MNSNARARFTWPIVEVKIGGESLVGQGAATLNKLESLAKAKGLQLPTFKMVLTAVGDFAYRRKEDDVIVCPLSALKD